MELLYVTSSDIKFRHAAQRLAEQNIQLRQADFEFEEMQSDSPGKIATHKAEQAFAQFQTPLLVSDDHWSIPALNGFPGSYMKQLNSWFSPEHWLRLMDQEADQRIKIVSCLVYVDQEHVNAFERDATYYFRREVDEVDSVAPHLRVISREPGGISVAREIQEQGFVEVNGGTYWSDVAQWLKKAIHV